MARWLVACVLAGCYRPTPELTCTVGCETVNGDTACPGDMVCGADLMCHAAGDVECTISPGDDVVCQGNSFVRVCFHALAPVELISHNIDTDHDALCNVNVTVDAGIDSCVVAGTRVTIAGTNVVTGSRPLVIVSADELSLDGTLDVASHQVGHKAGPGSALHPADCVGATRGKDAGPNKNAGGGAGGSFGQQGGRGGLDDTQDTTAGKAAVAPAQPRMLVSGCAGTRGGDESAAGGVGGLAGANGGVVALVASTITISSLSVLNASGAGGDGSGTGHNGGGGGGAGGLVLLDGALDVHGAVLANGGGGGSRGNAGALGDPGDDPVPGGGAGKGGTSPGGDGDGGDGSLGSIMPKNGEDHGGGGGGGAGIIYVTTSIPIALSPFSPVPAPAP